MTSTVPEGLWGGAAGGAPRAARDSALPATGRRPSPRARAAGHTRTGPRWLPPPRPPPRGSRRGTRALGAGCARMGGSHSERRCTAQRPSFRGTTSERSVTRGEDMRKDCRPQPQVRRPYRPSGSTALPALRFDGPTGPQVRRPYRPSGWVPWRQVSRCPFSSSSSSSAPSPLPPLPPAATLLPPSFVFRERDVCGGGERERESGERESGERGGERHRERGRGREREFCTTP
jgi:hypothetical protein